MYIKYPKTGKIFLNGHSHYFLEHILVVELERVDEHSNLKRRIFMIRIIRGNVTDSKLAAVSRSD